MLEINVLALAVGCQAAIRAMRATGSDGNIVNISSMAAIRRDSGVYGATKHAVNCINSTLRKELEDDPIRVTSIMPGVFATNFSRHMDPARSKALPRWLGINDVRFDDEGRLPPDQIAQFQPRCRPPYGDVDHIAEPSNTSSTQPIEINIEELMVRPQKSLFS